MIQVRPANDDDRQEILVRMDEVSGTAKRQRIERRWDWQWRQDPRLDVPGYRGVVVEWRDSIIASMSCVPAALYIAGAPVSANWIVDIFVHTRLTRQALRDARRGGGGLGPEFAKGIAAAMLDHPAAGSIQLGKHIADRMMAVGLTIGFVQSASILNYTRRVSVVRPVQKGLGKGLGLLLGSMADLAVSRFPRPALEAEPFHGDFDARFDRLWARARDQYPAITLRDARTLNWRYRRHPDTAYEVLILQRDGEIRGYAVFKLYEHRGRWLARMVDLLTENGDQQAADGLVAGVLARARSEKAERLDWFACAWNAQPTLGRYGFAPKLTKAKSLQPLMMRGLPDVELYVTRGDGDGG